MNATMRAWSWAWGSGTEAARRTAAGSGAFLLGHLMAQARVPAGLLVADASRTTTTHVWLRHRACRALQIDGRLLARSPDASRTSTAEKLPRLAGSRVRRRRRQ